MATVYIGLGTNLGNREANLELAMRLFKPEFRIRKTGPTYETDMLYRLGKPRYFNQACCVETDLSPEETLEKCRAIERSMGRKKAHKYEPRVMDVVILLYDSVVLKTGDLTIPHPRLHERAHALVPLSRIAGNVVHPVLNKTINQLVAELGDYSHKIVEIDQRV